MTESLLVVVGLIELALRVVVAIPLGWLAFMNDEPIAPILEPMAWKILAERWKES